MADGRVVTCGDRIIGGRVTVGIDFVLELIHQLVDPDIPDTAANVRSIRDMRPKRRGIIDRY